jgi:predicted peptidase
MGLFPQLPDGWRWDTPGAGEMVGELVEQICRKYPRVDRDRIYLSGLSMGGKGTWLAAYASPQTYAMIAPISAVAVRPKAAPEKFAGMYTWIICGEYDHLFTQGSKQMYEAMQGLGSERVRLTVVPQGQHYCWNQFYPTRSFYEELMRHRRR